MSPVFEKENMEAKSHLSDHNRNQQSFGPCQNAYNVSEWLIGARVAVLAAEEEWKYFLLFLFPLI